MYTHQMQDGEGESGALMALGFVSECDQELGIMGLMHLFYQSYVNNVRSGITGVLFFDGSSFGQILEGADGDVEDRWNVIKKDLRHRKVCLLGKQYIAERTYKSWTMQVKDGDVIGLMFPEFCRLISELQPEVCIPEIVRTIYASSHCVQELPYGVNLSATIH